MTQEVISEEKALGQTELAPELPSSAPMISVSTEALEALRANIKALQEHVVGVLEPGTDYGIIPGIQQPSLWEPGADKVFAAFGCLARPVLITKESDPEQGLLCYIYHAQVYRYGSERLVAEGIGVASTRESKYGVRWVEDPEPFGYPKSQVRKRHDKASGKLKYRIPNPDWGDLEHTLSQMAWKRAKVDAAQALPGVSSVLRKLFTSPQRPQKAASTSAAGRVSVPTDVPPEPAVAEPSPPAGETPDWNVFWGEMKSFGFTADQVHEALGVKSIVTDWSGKGRTLEEARRVILEKLTPKMWR